MQPMVIQSTVSIQYMACADALKIIIRFPGIDTILGKCSAEVVHGKCSPCFVLH